MVENEKNGRSCRWTSTCNWWRSKNCVGRIRKQFDKWTHTERRTNCPNCFVTDGKWVQRLSVVRTKTRKNGKRPRKWSLIIDRRRKKGAEQVGSQREKLLEEQKRLKDEWLQEQWKKNDNSNNFGRKKKARRRRKRINLPLGNAAQAGTWKYQTAGK